MATWSREAPFTGVWGRIDDYSNRYRVHVVVGLFPGGVANSNGVRWGDPGMWEFFFFFSMCRGIGLRARLLMLRLALVTCDTLHDFFVSFDAGAVLR